MDKDQSNNQQDKEQAHIARIKEFFNSEAWNEYALPLIGQVASRELPKPNAEGWERRYVYHYALSEALSLVINTLTNLSNKDEFLKRAEQYIAGIDEA